jgi:predicted nucleic acid-binding protein
MGLPAGDLQMTARRCSAVVRQCAALADMLIAAVALAYNLTLVTDNAKDFPMTDLKLLPLQSPAG